MVVDSDIAGDVKTRRSPVGQVACIGNHVVTGACTLLKVTGLSHAENEYHAISVGSCTGLGRQSPLRDWSANARVRIASD